MGSRGRSIRLRIYFLVAIPLITMLCLFAYEANTSVTNWLNVDRSPNLIKSTGEPITRFVSLLQAERRAAVVYLSHPDAASLNAYQSAIMTAKAGELPLEVALNSPGTKSSTNAQETAAITAWVGEVNGMTGLRAEVAGKKLPPLNAFAAYTKIITDQDSVFQAQANSETNTEASFQGLGLISTVNAREDLDEQDAVLAGALASGSLTPAERVAFNLAAGRQQDDTALYSALLTPAELAKFNAPLNTPTVQALRGDLTTVQQAVGGGATLREMKAAGLSPASWQELTSTLATANFNGGTATVDTELATVLQVAENAKTRVWQTAAIGAAGLILTLIVTILLARSINRRLTVLRRSALTLAERQLPAVVARLRRGESVDIAAEAPPLRVGSDEIGQVGQAIDTVRQTAIKSAVEEARLRQGINDVFRNLARRNQSLLQRQLTTLDAMERRATDPDVLEDLFKLDHLTTRMRRHAEGLIILSGSPPGRSWSAPVKLIDVMRGAIAEVEDYARVTVASQSRAALAGTAVTDVIHLLAELIENATSLSPPFTQVKVTGETVANGFAIEIEDRGLGMTPARMAELNERLSNPPDVNPANTEQLGLFVVGQLARRHGILVTLRHSPYGGTTAVALIPQRLIVEEGPAAITAGDSGGATAGAPMGAAMSGSMGGGPATGPHPPVMNGGGYNGGGPNGGSYGARNGSYGSPGGYGSGYGGQGGANGGSHGGGYGGGYGGGGYGRSGSYPEPAAPTFTPSAPAGSGAFPVSRPDLGNPPADQGGYGRTGAPGAQGGGANGDSSSDGRRGRHGAPEVPVVTGVPVSRSAAPPASSFDVFPPLRRSDQDDDAAPGGVRTPYTGSYPDYGNTSPAPSPYPEAGKGNNGGSGGDHPNGEAAGSEAEDYKGLPRRVRQANLAPQLRSSAAGSEPTGVPQATSASLSDMRNTLSAMQRGWQQGRAQSQRDTEGNVDGD